MKKMNNKGFTIVELVIVIAVIAILAAVMIPTFSSVVSNARQTAAIQEVTNHYKAALADDLATADTSDDDVYNKGEIKVTYDGFNIVISAAGEVSAVSGTFTANYTLSEAGEFAAITTPGT